MHVHYSQQFLSDIGMSSPISTLASLGMQKPNQARPCDIIIIFTVNIICCMHIFSKSHHERLFPEDMVVLVPVMQANECKSSSRCTKRRGIGFGAN